MRSYHIPRFILLLALSSLLVGCAMFGGSKPVPMGEVRFHMEQGDNHLKEDNYDKAVESYTAAIKLNPKSKEAHRKLAEAHAKYDKNDLALEEFAKTIEIDSKYAYAYKYRGQIYNNQEKWEEAAKEFESALKIEPDDLYSLNRLGLIYRMLSRYQDARNVLQKAVALDPEMDDPESRDTHYYLGIVYSDEVKYDEAIAEFSKALEHFPEDAEIYNHLGAVYESLERYQAAAEQYRKTLEIDPEDEFASSRLEAFQQAGVVAIEIPPVEIVKDEAEDYIAAAPDPDEYPNAGAIVLLDKLSYELTDEGRARYTIHQIVKICNERGIAEFGEVSIPFNAISQNIAVNIARTILPDGTEVEAATDAYHDITPPGLAIYNLYSDVLYRIISMPALEPGAVMEYKVTVEDATGDEMSWILSGMAFQWFEPILNSKCVLRVPEGKEIKWKLYNSQIEPVITKDNDGRSTYVWISKNNPGLVPETAMPPMEEVIPFLTYSTAESWDDVYQWYRDLADPQEQADKAIKRKTAELVAGKATNEEKTKAIFEYVASKIRYVAIELGMSAYQPHPAIDVFKYKYGDCKDKVTLLITMLREVGIEAYPVLISPAPHRKVDEETPSVGQFSHVITAVSVNDDGYVWLDPTVSTCGYGDLPAGDQGRRGFVIGKDAGEFMDTPVYPPDANKVVSNSEIAIMEDGTIQGWEQTTANGQANMYLRSVYRLIRSDMRRDFLEGIFNQRYPGVQIADFSISDLQNLDTPVEVRVDFSCPEYVSNSGKTIVFSLPSEEFSEYAALVSTADRKYDLVLGYNMSVEKTLTLSLPEGYKVDSLPEDESVQSELGRFVRKYETDGNSTVKYFVSLEINTPVVPAASYGKLKNLLETAAREDRAHVVLTKHE